MDWEVTTKIIGGVLALFGLNGLVFATKEKVNKDCNECRKEMYEAIKQKASDADLKALRVDYNSMLAIVIRVDERTKNIEDLLGKIEKRSGNG